MITSQIKPSTGADLSFDYVNNMSYRDLQKACKDRGLSASGKAGILRERLNPVVLGDVSDPISEGSSIRTSTEHCLEPKKVSNNTNEFCNYVASCFLSISH